MIMRILSPAAMHAGGSPTVKKFNLEGVLSSDRNE